MLFSLDYLFPSRRLPLFREPAWRNRESVPADPQKAKARKAQRAARKATRQSQKRGKCK